VTLIEATAETDRREAYKNLGTLMEDNDLVPFPRTKEIHHATWDLYKLTEVYKKKRAAWGENDQV